jgi:hypothetical protein
MINLIYGLFDRELFKKPFSRRLTAEIIRDITCADPAKWRHPILPKGSKRYNDLQGSYGYTKKVDGKDVPDSDHPFEDIYVYEHPDLTYRLDHYPLWTCREGYAEQITIKDMKRIAKTLYKSLDKRGGR